MNTDNESDHLAHKTKWQFLVAFTILWLITGWLITQGEKWLLILARTEDLYQGLTLAVAMSLVACVSVALLVNLYGVVLTIILPHKNLLAMQQRLTRYPFTLYILAKVVDRRLKSKT